MRCDKLQVPYTSGGGAGPAWDLVLELTAGIPLLWEDPQLLHLCFLTASLAQGQRAGGNQSFPMSGVLSSKRPWDLYEETLKIMFRKKQRPKKKKKSPQNVYY